MKSHSDLRRIGQLWQLPLLLLSLALFGYAVWRFVDPQPGLSIDQKIDLARLYLRYERPEAALGHLNKLLGSERMESVKEGQVHLLLAQSLEMGQRQRGLNIPANHHRIIEQSQLALGLGVQPDADVYRRLADSYVAVNRPLEALANYRQAMSMDPQRALRLQKKIIELQLNQQELDAADGSLQQYLASKDLTDAERGWAIGQRARILMDRGRLMEARTLLSESLKLEVDPVAQGQLNYYLAYCAWKTGDDAEAERLARVSREQLRVQHPLDADACYLLGRLAQAQQKPQEAISFYQVVLVSHIDSDVAPLARLGRALCRIAVDEDDAGLSDLQDVVAQIHRRPNVARQREQIVTGLQQASGMLTAKGNYQGALEAMSYEQTQVSAPPAAFFARLASLYEKRAEQLEKSIPDLRPAEQVARAQQVREMQTRAGDALLAYSRVLTLKDDKGYGEAMWRGIDLYEHAGDGQRAMAALELFVAERPEDPLAPEALLRLGRSYQAAGMFDKAISAFQRNQFRYSKSLAASRSAVPLAQAYIAKGPQSYVKAEAVLQSVVENNPLLTPDAEEFQQALFELGQLYYRTGRYEEAVGRLQEWTERYPKHPMMSQLLFLMADSYRKSAGLLEVQMAADKSQEATNARRERLAKANELYSRVVELYRAAPPQAELDRTYQRLSHFYRADCLYDLGQFDECIRQYDVAAFRYQDDPSALAAYVQIVNAYCALGKMEEAKTANERAKWLLRRMPSEAFENGGFTMPKQYWEQWLKWTSQAGMM